MQDMLTESKEYTMVLHKPGPDANSENVRNIIWSMPGEISPRAPMANYRFPGDSPGS
jgi:hypothetical protein